MVKIQGWTVVARPVEDVFDFVADERNEPKYNPGMVRAEKMTPGPVAKGTRWSATVQSRGRPVDMEIEVTDYTRPTRLGSTTRMSTAEIRGAVTFEPDPAGTKMRWSWQLQPKGALKLLGPLIARQGRRQETQIWAGLKRYMESTTSPTTDSDA
jgi:carbon monoxide dehydrogenase subunit G